ncbi:MAG: hypothetical protein ACRD5L_05495, partial [Bryobacteraceae bacterium]
MKHRWHAPLLAILAALSLGVAVAPSAQADDYSNARIVRLSYVEGDVRYLRPGEDWQEGQINLPIEQDFV